MAKMYIPPVSLSSDFTAIVTGPFTGVGYEVSKYLALLGARVILAGNSEIRGKATILRIQADVMEMRGHVFELEREHEEDADEASIGPSASERASTVEHSLRVEFLQLDLASLDSVQLFAAKLRERDLDLHLLFCNGSVIQVPKTQTEDGWEMHFQYNFLSHYLLTVLLLPQMLRHNEDSRILLSSDVGHTGGVLDMKNMQGVGKNDYDPKKFWANSQLYMIMFMLALERRLAKTNVSAFSVHNGHIDKLLKKDSEDIIKWSSVYSIGRKMDKIGRDTSKSVSNALRVAVDPAMKTLRGSFFVKGTPLTVSPDAKNGKLQELLWRYTVNCLKDRVTREDMKPLELSDQQMEDLGIDY